MKAYLCLLVLCITVGVNAGQAPSPVYRSAPTVLKQQVQPQPRAELPQQQQAGAAPQNSFSLQAEEREGQHGNVEPSANSKASVAAPVSGGQPQPGSQVKSQPAQQEFRVVYLPQPSRDVYSNYLQPGVQELYPQQQAGQVTPLTAYQSPAGANGQVAAPASDIWSSINWRDTGVALACLALVGAGSAMWYPRLAHFKARAMRELADIKAEDAGRMARSVMRAIQKFSELNNRQTAE